MIKLRTRTMKTRQSNNHPWVPTVVKANNDLEPAFDAIDNLAGCVGVVVDGNTTDYTGGATAGQYVILQNSTISGCPDGLYKVATGKTISAGSPIDATFLTSVGGGGLNDLRNTIPKTRDLSYSNIENSDSAKYYVTLDSDILATLGANKIISILLVSWAGLSSYANVMLPTNFALDGTSLFFLFPKGTVFSGGNITIRVLYS